jgi:1-acyl-sn-glycerol-3-phosphate acyltransferase
MRVMGRGLSFLTVYETARITLPTFVEAISGRISRDKGDARVKRWSKRIVDRARMRLDVRGLNDVPNDRAFVYMSNHQSHMDIPVLYRTVPARTLRMVTKKELFRIPLWGRAMRDSGFIEVDRSNREKAIASLHRAEQQIADGVSVWIAPEGSRSATGELGPLKKGGFHVAVDTNTPIIPVAISGTRNVLPKGSTSMAYDVPVRVVFGEPIDVAGRSIDELLNAVREFLERNVSRT